MPNGQIKTICFLNQRLQLILAWLGICDFKRFLLDQHSAEIFKFNGLLKMNFCNGSQHDEQNGT